MKIGRNTFGTERYFKFVEETENDVIIPRGVIGKLIRFCRENRIEFNFVDKREKHKAINFVFNAQLRDHQQKVIESIVRKDLGVIVAPSGSGKTIVGLKIISEKQQPALIIVHRKQLVDQWIERIETFLGIPRAEIGKIGQGKNKIGKQITVATIQSLTKELSKSEDKIITKGFGTIILDECHHIPAETFRNTISMLQTYYLYGLTATPFRKYNDGKLIFIHLGEIIAETKSDEISKTKQAKIIIRNTELDVPYNPKTDNFETISKVLIHDSARNKYILEDVKYELNKGKKVVIITERKEHIDSLFQFLKNSYEVITLSGEDTESKKNLKWKILKEGDFQALITTGQFFGEGTDLQNVNCLFLVYPFSFEGKLIQYIGRVQRSEITPKIYDYRDFKIDYLNKLFLKRNAYYRKIDKQASLFDDPVEEIVNIKNTITIEQSIKVPIVELEFQYGCISFKYREQDTNTELEFVIENLNIRPEFEVLLPYFSKVLKTNSIKVDINAEIEDGKVISQLAKSSDIEKINHEVIEGVKFKFISKNIINPSFKNKIETLATINEIQNGEQQLYNDGLDLLEDILRIKNYKHSRQLKYLAKRHEGTVLKIRFVLMPFSFVLLLAGKEQFHVVLETLDTEEATYLWHTDKNKSALISKVKEIDQQLSLIREKGREAFLKSEPENFSRIMHDYTEENKGFIIWKDLLEEQII